MLLNPLTVSAWLAATATDESFGVDAWLVSQNSDIRIEGRIYPADAVPANPAFPFVVYSGTGTLDNYAEQVVLSNDDITLRAVMRKDRLPVGIGLREYTAQIAQALESAFTSVRNPAATQLGRVHGCQTRGWYRPPIYGDEGTEVCEMGVVLRIWSS